MLLLLLSKHCLDVFLKFDTVFIIYLCIYYKAFWYLFVFD